MRTLALMAIAAVAATAQAQQPQTGGFVVTLGRDTISAESYTRAGSRVEGIIARRSPRTSVVRYVLTLTPNGTAERLAYNTRNADGSMPPNAAVWFTVDFTRDSAVSRFLRNDTTRMIRNRIENPFPEIDGGVSFYATAIAALNAMMRDSADFHAYVGGASQGEPMPVAKRAPGRYWVYSFGSPIEVTVDDDGNVLSVDASRTTVKIQSRRLPTVDVAAIANGWAARERAAGAMGALSPNDSTVATVGAARIRIEYGRPAARGRVIWGSSGVLGDTLWRTGANASTKFIISAPVTLGGQSIPAGNYVLTTLAIPGRYQLIVSQEGREVARVPLRAAPLSPSIERFTIAVEGGQLKLMWDNQVLSATLSG
jgi:hypothetical protein